MSFTVSRMPQVRWSSDESRLAAYADAAPRIPWDKFMRDVYNPLPGEHTLILGHTGAGKTQLLAELMPKYPFIAVFATKNNDATMDRLIREGGYAKFSKWQRVSATEVPRRVIWPPKGKLKEIIARQQIVFEDAIERIWAEGGRPREAPVGWAIGLDEIFWFSQVLKLDGYLKIILQQGRSSGISLVGATQRPAWIPVEFYSQSTHIFLFQEKEQRNLERIGEINYGNKMLIRDLVTRLDTHQVLYVNSRTGIMARTRSPAPMAA